MLDEAGVGPAEGGVSVDTLPLLCKDDDLNAALWGGGRAVSRPAAGGP